MLRQYGISTPSSLKPILHPEDAQPNEGIHGRNQKLPPRIIGTAVSSRGTDQQTGYSQRGGYRGRGMYRGGPFTQYAVRGNSSWRDRGGGHGSYSGGPYPVRKPQLQDWSRQESNLSSAAPVDAMEPVPIPAPAFTSSQTSTSNMTNPIHPPPSTSFPAVATHTVSKPQNSHATYIRKPQLQHWSRQESNLLPATSTNDRDMGSTTTAAPVYAPSLAPSKTNASNVMRTQDKSLAPSTPAVSAYPISESQDSRATYIRKPQMQHWSRQEKDLSSAEPIDSDTDAMDHTPASAPAFTSSRTSTSNMPIPIHRPRTLPFPAVSRHAVSETQTTYIRKPQPVHWSRQESSASSAAPIDVDRMEPPTISAPVSVPTFTSSKTSTSNTSNIIRTKDRSPAHSISHSIPATSTHTISELQNSRIPQWLLRSRSPSPKLPPTPLKRRKLDSDNERPDLGQTMSSRLSIPPIEAIPSPVPLKPRIPLPARTSKRPMPPQPVRSPTPPTRVKEEKFSPVKIKRESEPSSSVKPERRSPSLPPSVEPERKLIRQSAKFYALPASCRKSNPQFAEERRSYFRQKSKELLKLGLKKTKAFWRDDGLVIEWSSDVPVWSDTLEPDIPDLATAIERAYALNDRSQPRKNSKRKRRSSVTSDASSPRSITLIEAPAPSSSQPATIKRKRSTSTKHWADGIPLEELEHATNLLTSPARERPVKGVGRPSLPTRKPISKPKPVPSNVPKLPFKQPDPSAAIPSQEWRTRRAGGSPPISASARMIFKPTNPRKSQAAVQDTPVAMSAGAQRPAQRPIDPPLIGTELVQNESSQGRHDYPRETVSAPFEVSTGRDVPTPECASRSPTLVNETLFTTSPHDLQARRAGEGLVYMPEQIPVSMYDGAVIGTTDAREESECIAMVGLHETLDPEDLYSEDGGPTDEEIEHNVQQFISKYASIFDSDRHNLKKAYSKDALFSCRVHHAEPYSCASLFVPESKDSFRSIHSRASQVIRRRTHICDRLLTLGQYQFIPRGIPQNPFYTWSIPKSSGVINGILLSLHGEVVKTEANPALDHRLTVDQTFLLRQRTEEDDTDDDDGTDVPGQTNLKNFWPLTIVSHQMTVRSNPLLSPEDLEDHMPWVRDILS